jgi:hypothetical protein
MKFENAAEGIYAFVLSRSKRGATLREIQRALEFSSASSALYHLDKLETKGILAKNETGKYVVRNRMGTKLDRNFFIVRNNLIPKHLPYALAMTLLSVTYLIVLGHSISSYLLLLALLPNVASGVIFWHETFDEIKIRPKFRISYS